MIQALKERFNMHKGIEMRVSLPRHIVEEALVILIAMRIIVMVTS